MGDDKGNTGTPDDRINLGEDYEVQYWTGALGVTEGELRAAVEAVGPMSEYVRNHLAQQA